MDATKLRTCNSLSNSRHLLQAIGLVISHVGGARSVHLDVSVVVGASPAWALRPLVAGGSTDDCTGDVTGDPVVVDRFGGDAREAFGREDFALTLAFFFAGGTRFFTPRFRGIAEAVLGLFADFLAIGHRFLAVLIRVNPRRVSATVFAL